MTLRDAAILTGYSADYLRVAIHRKILRASKVGTTWTITAKALDKFANRKSKSKGT